MRSSDEARSAPSGDFAATRWTLVLAAGRDGDRTALADLCAIYWMPVYAFIRRRGHSADATLDLTQGFFAHFIEKQAIASADPTRGRFRSFLLRSVQNFVNNERERDQAQKRGGGVHVISIDAVLAEQRYQHEPLDRLTPEKLFDRRWAIALLDRVLHRLSRDAGNGNRAVAFERLKGFLQGAAADDSYAKAAGDLGMTEPAVKTAVHRLRGRFAALLREEIGRTIESPEEVEDEIRRLFEALSP